jgi:hypothetical protein
VPAKELVYKMHSKGVSPVARFRLAWVRPEPGE